MLQLTGDLRHALRILGRNPGFAALVIATLALGIGLTTAVFSVVNGVLLKPLSFDQPDRILTLNTRWPAKGRQSARVTGGDYVDLRSQATSFEAISTYAGGEVGVQFPDHAEFSGVYWVSRGYFDVLRLAPAYGRLFEDSEAERAAVVSLAFAERHFGGGGQAAVGRVLRIENRAYEITGVLPDHLPYPRKAEVWAATPFTPENLNRTAFNYRALARLGAGVSLEAAQAQLQTIGARLESTYPDNRGKTFVAAPLAGEWVKPVRSTLLMLLGAVVLVLLISCANVANLLLARATTRAREIAVRLSVGATRARVARQLFVESLLVAVIAGGLGAVIAVWGTEALIRLAPRDLPRLHDVQVDFAALAFASAVSLVASLIFGLAPAWQSSRVDLHDALKQGGLRLVGGASPRLRSALLVGEIALSFVLAVGAGLLFRSFVNLMTSELGYRASGLLVMYAHKPAQGLEEARRATRTFERIYARLRTLAGVRSVAGAMGLPAGEYGSNGLYEVEGKPATEQARDAQQAGFRLSSPGYFATLGVPLARGRDFNDGDQYDAPFVAVISQSLERRSFPGQDPIGRRIRCGLDAPDHWMTVVGVVGDVRQDSPASAPEPELYMPLAQHPYYANEVQVAIRTDGAPAQWTQAVRAEVAREDPAIATRFTTLDAMLSESVAAPRFRTFLVSLFAAIALALAMGGVYGLMSYLVAQRTPEFGLRLALGAGPGNLLRLVLGRSLALAGAGLALGLAVAWAARQAVSSMLFGLEPADLPTWAAILALTLLVSGAAAAVPAWRASRTEPVAALRNE